jgi:hypothetical protein
MENVGHRRTLTQQRFEKGNMPNRPPKAPKAALTHTDNLYAQN